MKSLYTLGVAAGFAVLAAGFSISCQRRTRGSHRHQAGPRRSAEQRGRRPPAAVAVVAAGAAAAACAGVAATGVAAVGHWGVVAAGAGVAAAGMRGWHGNRWYGGRRWYGGGGWYGGGWGWGFPLVVAPYAYNNGYYNDDCGYATVRRWVNGRRIWVRRYQCW